MTLFANKISGKKIGSQASQSVPKPLARTARRNLLMRSRRYFSNIAHVEYDRIIDALYCFVFTGISYVIMKLNNDRMMLSIAFKKQTTEPPQTNLFRSPSLSHL